MLKRQQDNIKQVLKLIEDNPELEILPMVDSQCVPNDDFCYWMGEWGTAEIDEYYCLNERIYFKGEDYEELTDKWIDDNYGDEAMDCKEWQKAKERAAAGVESYDWVKAIIVKINSI